MKEAQLKWQAGYAHTETSTVYYLDFLTERGCSPKDARKIANTLVPNDCCVSLYSMESDDKNYIYHP